MGLMQRVSDILKANINRMLDQAEDPELVLDQLIQEMQETYRKSKIEVAKALADEKRLKHLLQTNQDMAAKWGRKAVLAVEKNDDDLAREALKRKRSYEDIAHEFQAQWNEQKKVTDVLRENLFGLESKIDEARRKKSLLVARQKRALAQKKLQDTLDQATSEQTYLTIGKFEEKITEIEARAEAEIDLIDGEFEGRFRTLERTGDNVEDELAALKTQVGGRKAGEQKLLAPESAAKALPEPGQARASKKVEPQEQAKAQERPAAPEPAEPQEQAKAQERPEAPEPAEPQEQAKAQERPAAPEADEAAPAPEADEAAPAPEAVEARPAAPHRAEGAASVDAEAPVPAGPEPAQPEEKPRRERVEGAI
jgi:phage shock protein A